MVNATRKAQGNAIRWDFRELIGRYINSGGGTTRRGGYLKTDSSTELDLKR